MIRDLLGAEGKGFWVRGMNLIILRFYLNLSRFEWKMRKFI